MSWTSPKRLQATTRSTESGSDARSEAVVLVHLRQTSLEEREEMDEFRLLAQSAGATVRGLVVGAPRRPDPATFMGQGKVEETRSLLETQPDVQLVLVNHELTPAQERNLERALSCRVLDRTGLILTIFARRARSHEGKLQVELAQLEHLATRLVRGWSHLERQKGGIGLRGPGETQLETDRRLLAERIRSLNRALAKVAQRRLLRRRARNKIPVTTVSLVGYTNAGKSSLFNALTGAATYTADRLFATLDPTMRRLELPGKTEAILTDTVGFIRRLPHGLVAAFHATLEEIREAAMLLHVVDASDPERQEYAAQVEQVLEEIGAEQVPRLLIFNKIDRMGESARYERDSAGRIVRIWLSAHTGDGLEFVRQALGEYQRRERCNVNLSLPVGAGRLRALVYSRLHVVHEEVRDDGSAILELELGEADLGWLKGQEDFHHQWLSEPREVSQ